MGMILNRSFRKMFKGYPTMSDKYNVAPGNLVGSASVHFGDLVKFSSTKGYFEAITSTVTLADIAGFVLATNVKLAEWDNVTVETKPGEAFNLAIGGNTFMAIELDSGATESYVVANAPVEVILATGKCTTSDKASSGTIVALPNVVFTGVYEIVDSKILAEILIK